MSSCARGGVEVSAGPRAGRADPRRARPFRDGVGSRRAGKPAPGSRPREAGLWLAYALHRRSGNMKTTRGLYSGMVAVGITVILAACAAELGSQQGAEPAVLVGENDLGGVVTSANGPEAGVWVIAETTDLPTKYAKIVATDDRGRYVMPDLPKAGYTVWVRGYGLVDSPKVRTAPGKTVNLTAVLAPSPAAAAQYYPAIYWYSMLKIPQKSEFPVGKAAHQGEWLNAVKSGGCNACHAMGTPGTRTMPKDFAHLKPSAEAWGRRIQSGQALTQMVRDITRHDAQRALSLFGDWTDRIAAGELPFATPERPRGI